MNIPKTNLPLETVLESYVASNFVIDYSTLNTWQQWYPQYAEALAEFTINWLEMDEPTLEQRQYRSQDDNLSEQAIKIVERITNTDQKPLNFTGIVETAKSKNIKLNILAKILSLSPSFVRKLDRCLVIYNTIPRILISKVANTLGFGEDTINQYLQQSPKLAQGTRYRSETIPTLATNQEPFITSIQHDPSLTEEDRIYWLQIATVED